jgi:hypothetical protein
MDQSSYSFTSEARSAVVRDPSAIFANDDTEKSADLWLKLRDRAILACDLPLSVAKNPNYQ